MTAYATTDGNYLTGGYDAEHPPFGLPWHTIAQICFMRQANRSPLFVAMQDVRDRYNGTWVLPLPDVEGEPVLPPLTPAIIANGTDNLAVQASSVLESIWYPALNPHAQQGRTSLAYARIRRQALAATWFKNTFNLTRRRAYRHLAAYATCAIVVAPDFKTEMPRIEIRDPLACLPEEKSIETVRPPINCGFTFRRSGEDLRSRFPKLQEERGGPISADDTWQSWQTLEWFDEESIVYGLMGPIEAIGPHIARSYEQTQAWMEIVRFPNRAGYTPVIVPERVTLDRLVSHMANVIGIVDLQAKLRALHILAAEKGIWPTLYAVGVDGRSPEIVNNGGEWQDGRTGKINLLKGVAKVDMIRAAPDMSIESMIDRMERDANINIDVAPMMNGENNNSLRTGRGLDTMAGMSIDPKILELHEIMQAYLPIMNEAIAKCYVGYWPDKKYVMFSGWPGTRGHVEFTPSQHLEESYENIVTYPVPGANLQTTTVILGQLQAAKAIPTADFRRRHPLIDDEDEARIGVDTEDLWDAQKRAVSVAIATGQAPPELGMFLGEELAKGGNQFEALQKAYERLKVAQEKEQADQAQQQGQLPQPAMGPGGASAGPGGPQMSGGTAPAEPMPGGTAPGPGGAPGATPTSASIGPNPDQAGMRRVMLALNAGRSNG
jgi:hypothetical protein